ncbi:MAG: alpha/beta hydrolase [Chloroflexi bacterium]|nr:alpha/beta hydrolase [Chloroflexota bacterium]
MPVARINQVDIFYEITGEGFPVVWCHEFAGDYRSWEPQVRHFSRLYRNVTFNWRGYPPSSVPTDPQAYSQELLVADLLGLLDHLGIEQAHLVGLSMGGSAVLSFALQHPERCTSIVAAGTGSGTTQRERFERDVQHVVSALLHQGMEALAAFYTRGPSRQPFLRKDPKGWQEFHAQFAAHSALGSALTMQGVQLRRPTIFALKEQLNQLRVPTLVLVGDEDEACLEPGVFMKREIPSAGLAILSQSGHTLNLEEPQAFNQVVQQFFHLVEAGKWPVRQEVTTSLLPEATRA